MATRIEDLEEYVNERVRWLYDKLDPKYRQGMSNFILRYYRPLEDWMSRIVSFKVDPQSGKMVSVRIGIKHVYKHELEPKDVNAIGNLIRDLGYEDVPIHVDPFDLSITAERDDRKFHFSYISAKTGVHVDLEFPLEMKEEIPKITEAFYKLLRVL